MRYDVIKFPERLRTAMKNKGWSAVKLEEVAKIKRQTIYNWLSGLCVPKLTDLVAVAEALGTTVDYLCGGYEKKAPPKPAVGPKTVYNEYEKKQLQAAYNHVAKAMNELRPAVARIIEGK